MWYELCALFKKTEIEDYDLFVKNLLKSLSEVLILDYFFVKGNDQIKNSTFNEFLKYKIKKNERIECDLFDLSKKIYGKRFESHENVGFLDFNWKFYDKNDSDYYEGQHKPEIMGEDYILLQLNLEDEALNFSFSHPEYDDNNRPKLHHIFSALIEQNASRIFIITEHDTKEMELLPVYYDSIDTFLKVISYYEDIPEISDELKEKLEKNLPDLMAIAKVYVQKHKKGFSLHPSEVVEYYKMQDKMEPARLYKLNDDAMERVKTKLNPLHCTGGVIYEVILSFIKENQEKRGVSK